MSFYAFSVYSQALDIPKGVVYHKASKVINEQAKKRLEVAFENVNSSDIFETTVMIGPNMWAKFQKSQYAFKNDEGIDLNFKIPFGKEIVTRKGRIIMKQPDFFKLWNYISTNLKNYKIRTPSKTEIEYYWFIIAYDIEEPIYVVESSKMKILFNFNPTNNKLIFVESLN